MEWIGRWNVAVPVGLYSGKYPQAVRYGNMKVLGVVDIPFYIILIIGIIVLFYIYAVWHFNFFKSRGIPGPTPYPFVGNNIDLGFMYHFPEWKRKYGNVFGFFLGREPVFVISDLDVLKEIFVKSFNSLRNRKRLQMVGNPLNLSVFFLEDAAWKRVRNIITPTFSGGKLRAMCPAINDCARILTDKFVETGNKKESVNMKEYFGAYTMDVIARTAFGVEVDSQSNKDDPFVYNAKEIFTPQRKRRALIMLASIFPFMDTVLRKLGFRFFPNDVNNFFINNITQMMKQRQQESSDVSEKRTDFLHLLMKAEIQEDTNDQTTAKDTVANDHLPDKQSLRHLTTDEIVGQGILFLIAGYETTASTLNYASYALATNPDVQEKAYQEIKEVLGDDEPNYDNISKLKYLENVLLETLRLYPPVVSLHRTASETVTMKGIIIPKGYSVFIPTFAIQRDPELFEAAEEFRPERHDEKSNPLTFLSFGYGPRICIGMRLALVEVKIALVHVLRKAKFVTLQDTPTKLNFFKLNILALAEPNILKLSPRDEC